MRHMKHGNMVFHMVFTVFLSNRLSANMCEINHENSSKGSSDFTQKCIQNRSKIDAENRQKIICDLD